MAPAIREALPRCRVELFLAAAPLPRLLLLSVPPRMGLRALLPSLLRVGPLRGLLLLPCGRLSPRGRCRLVHPRCRARHRRGRGWVHRLHHAGAGPAALREVVWLEHRISSAGCPWGVAYSFPRECCHASETRRRSGRRHPRLLHAARVVREPLPASPFLP